MRRGVDHFGISVSKLDRAVEFYRDLLHLEVVEEGNFGGVLYEQILGLPGARGRVALLRGHNVQVELFEFAYPVPMLRSTDRPVCEHGITHFGIQVDDVQADYARLKSAGMTFHSPPIEFPGIGRAVYGRDPDGNVIELLELTQG